MAEPGGGDLKTILGRLYVCECEQGVYICLYVCMSVVCPLQTSVMKKANQRMDPRLQGDAAMIRPENVCSAANLCGGLFRAGQPVPLPQTFPILGSIRWDSEPQVTLHLLSPPRIFEIGLVG